MQQNYCISLVLLNISGLTINIMVVGNPFFDITNEINLNNNKTTMR